MRLQSAIAAALPELRAEAESRMSSRATVKRESPTETTKNSDGFEVPAWVLVHSGLPCRIGGSDRGGSGSRRVSVGGVEVDVAVRVAHFPASTSGLMDGDLIEVTGGEFTGFLRIVEAAWQDQATARRVPVIEAQQPDGWLA